MAGGGNQCVAGYDSSRPDKTREQGVISRTHGGVTLNRFIPTNRLPMRKCSAAWRKNMPSPRSGVNGQGGGFRRP